MVYLERCYGVFKFLIALSYENPIAPRELARELHDRDADFVVPVRNDTDLFIRHIKRRLYESANDLYRIIPPPRKWLAFLIVSFAIPALIFWRRRTLRHPQQNSRY